MMRVYAYEAFILVLASSIMGVVIGTVIAWTFGQQVSFVPTASNPCIVLTAFLAAAPAPLIVAEFFVH